MPAGFDPRMGQVLQMQHPHPDDELPVSQVVFMAPPEEKDSVSMAAIIKAAQEGEKSPVIKVKVVGAYRVVHEGEPFIGGDVLEVPNDAEHQIWLKSGWVEEVVKPAPAVKKEES